MVAEYFLKPWASLAFVDEYSGFAVTNNPFSMVWQDLELFVLRAPGLRDLDQDSNFLHELHELLELLRSLRLSLNMSLETVCLPTTRL